MIVYKSMNCMNCMAREINYITSESRNAEVTSLSFKVSWLTEKAWKS